MRMIIAVEQKEEKMGIPNSVRYFQRLNEMVKELASEMKGEKMPKLIDADKLKQHYAWWDNEDKKIFDTIVDLQPEAVVRCKDCIHYKGLAECDVIGECMGTDGYCAWGERREDA